MAGLDKLVILTGAAKEREVSGMFDAHHLSQTLDGRAIVTAKPKFSCSTNDTEQVKAGDQVVFGSRNWIIARVMHDATGLSVLEFEEDLDGDTTHEILT